MKLLRQQDRLDARAARAAFVGGLAPAVRGALEQALARHVLPALGSPGILGTYAACGDEINPRALEMAAQAAGWRLAWPRVFKGAPLGFHMAQAHELKPGTLGIPEPPEDALMVAPDVLLVPLLAVDLQGNRLGQGGGYYDWTLTLMRIIGRVPAIGIAWDVQIVEIIATESWDQPLDALATPTAFHAFDVDAKASL